MYLITVTACEELREVAVKGIKTLVYVKDLTLADGTGNGIYYFVERNFLGDSAVLTLKECKQC